MSTSSIFLTWSHSGNSNSITNSTREILRHYDRKRASVQNSSRAIRVAMSHLPLDVWSLSDTRPIDVRRSKPVNMPISKTNAVLIESSSAGSAEISLLDTYHKSIDDITGLGELQLREDLADAMQECAGRETGGHIIVMSKQQAPVAKIVNPLGTVVTVHSDDEQDVEVTEESVIHENCDEALFRPVVAARPVQHSDNKYTYHHGEDIIVHSLHSTSEVAVQLPDIKNNVIRKDQCSLSSDVSSKAVKTKPYKQKDINKSTKNKSNLNEIKSVSLDGKCNKTKSNNYIINTLSSNLTEHTCNELDSDEGKSTSKHIQQGTEPLIESTDKNIFTKTKYKQKFESREQRKPESNKQIVEVTQSNSEICHKSFILDELEAPMEQVEAGGFKVDSTDIIKKCEGILSSNVATKNEYVDHLSSRCLGLEAAEINDDGGSVEKNISKKTRKPKVKLGVRIPITETSTKLTMSNESLSSSETSFQPKMSYSAMAASRPQEKEKSKSPSPLEDKYNESKEETKMVSSIESLSRSLDMQKSFDKIDEDLEAGTIEDFIPSKQKLSYNVVAASRQNCEKSPIIMLENDNQLDLSLNDSIDSIPVKVSKKYELSKMEEKLIDFDSPLEITGPLEDSFECQSDSKKDSVKDKSSDDEKIDSPVETTESDDVLTEEQLNNPEKSEYSQVSKSAKRKARKKKK